MIICTSHAPLMLIRPRAPAAEPRVLELRAQLRAAIETYDPEQIVFVGNNHFAGFHYSLMPPYCVGLEARALPDLGGFEGDLDVPRHDALALLGALRDAGFDPAVSYRMKVDHAFSQPLQLLAGGLARYPVIPVFVSTFTPPFLSFRRSRQFGEALGRHLATCGKRTLIMGSGGLSHHPTRYFPLMTEATPEVLGYQMDGDRGGTMSDEQWFTRFSHMHVEGAEMASDGRRTASDMRLNAALDRQSLDDLARGNLQAFDDWQADWVAENAGVGMLEMHTWLIAAAAHRQMAPAAHLQTYQAEIVEYGIDFAMLWSDA